MAKTVKVGKLRFPLDRRYYIRKGAHIWILPGLISGFMAMHFLMIRRTGISRPL